MDKAQWGARAEVQQGEAVSYLPEDTRALSPSAMSMLLLRRTKPRSAPVSLISSIAWKPKDTEESTHSKSLGLRVQDLWFKRKEGKKIGKEEEEEGEGGLRGREMKIGEGIVLLRAPLGGVRKAFETKPFQAKTPWD